MTQTKTVKKTYEDIYKDIDVLATLIKGAPKSYESYDSIFAIARGGVPVALLLSQKLGLPVVDELKPNSLVVDDLIDSGKTLEQFTANDKAVLYRKPHSPGTLHYVVGEIDGWVQFPWEKEGREDAAENFRRILEYLGEDPTREGLLDTPKRYIKFMEQFLEKPEFKFTAFENEGTDEMVIQKDIHFYSLCEHHTAPFFGKAHVAYIPGEKIVGLSKLARTVHHYAGNFQNQERITTQIVERLEKELNPKGVAVMLEAKHLCMEMRGVKTHDTSTITTKLTGSFKDNHDTRNEFMQMVSK